MARTIWFVGAALGCWVAWAGAASAERPEPVERPAAEEGRGREARAPAARKARSVIGSKVSIRGGLTIGTVDDIIFSDEGYVDYLVVLNEGKYVLVPWEAAKFDFERRTASLEITQERFREVPTFTQESWPNVYEPVYRQNVYRYYGVQPRVERRGILRRR